MNNSKKLVYKNTIITLFTQIARLLLQFILQKIFIATLGIAYLGYNSVFTSILQMLNMADLGIGVAITSFLYKPLAEDNQEHISVLMHIYKSVYHFIGVGVALIGGIISIFLPTLIPDAACSNSYLRSLFIINLVGTVSTYFLAYKRTLVIAKQKSYFTNSVDLCVNLVGTALQICFLLIYPSYIVYLVISIAKNIVSNIIIGLSCNKKDYVSSNIFDKNLIQQYEKAIALYVKNVFIAKIGAYIYHGTDNIIISIFKGSLSAGYLSNYTMITTGLYAILNQVLASLQATYGNYIVNNNDKRKQYRMTNNYMYVDFILGNTCMICCLILFQPFIKIYLGDEYLLNYSTVVLLCINIFLTIILVIPSQIFIIYQLNNYDKYIILISAIMNIIISVMLVQHIGINGVLIGTLFTSLIYLFSRLYIIAKKIFAVSICEYLKKLLVYSCVTSATLLITWISTIGINVNSWIALICEGIMVGSMCMYISLLASYRMEETKYLLFHILPFNKKVYLLICGAITILIGIIQICLRFIL